MRCSIRCSSSSLKLLQRRRALGHPLLELGVEALELPGLAVQVDEHLDLGAQQLRHHGHGHVVHRPQLIAAQLVGIGVHDRGDENDGGVLKARMLADHGGELEAVEIGHAHVDQDERDLVLEQTFERLARRGGLEQSLPDLGEHDLVAQELRLAVVDKENVDLVGVGCGDVVHRCSHIRSADSNCSTLTGFAR